MAKVRVWAFNQVNTIPLNSSSGRLALDSIQMMKMPYLARHTLDVDAVTAQSTPKLPRGTQFVVVEVEQGTVCRFEVGINGNAAVADQDSMPVLGWNTVIEAHESWELSFIQST